MTVLWGINAVIVTVLIGRDRPGVYTIPAALAIAVGLILSVILIPPYGADGAALVSVLWATLLASLTVPAIIRLIGPISPLRVGVAPLGAGVLMALAALLLSGTPWVLAAMIATVTYGATLLVIERVFFPGDFAYYTGALRLRRVAKVST